MLSVFTNAWKVQDIRKRLMYIIMVLGIYRIGCQIPLPGINAELLLEAKTGITQNLFSIISGGEYGTIFAMGIGPYITASIIMQLLTVAIPTLEQLKKEGEEGRKKINQITRYLAVGLAAVQGAGTVFTLRTLFVYQNMFVYIMAVLAIVTGTIFIMWLGELVTERGIGNGASFIIFANILSGFPATVMNMYNLAVGGNWTEWAKLGAVVLIFIAVIAFVVLIQNGERRLPVQHSKKMVGRQMFGGQSSFIPLKVNIAGVMSIIFAISLLQMPTMLGQFWEESIRPEWITTAMHYLDITHPLGASLYVILIFFFTFFYTSFAMNAVEMAENMKKSGGFIPGIRPGKPTSEYIQRTIDRLSWIGALFYSVLALMPVLLEWTFGFQVGFGGTTLLIVVGVCLELVKQLESKMLMRHYKGFLS